MPFLKGDAKESPRKEFLYWSDDGDLMAIRYEQWKAAFLEQHTEMSPKTPVGVWQGQFTKLRLPNLYNLRTDPFERGPRASTTATGCSAGPSSRFRCRPSPPSGWRASRNSRRARNPRASTSTK